MMVMMVAVKREVLGYGTGGCDGSGGDGDA